MDCFYQEAYNSWFNIREGRQKFMQLILNRVMPGGSGRDLDLILDNDTIEPHTGKVELLSLKAVGGREIMASNLSQRDDHGEGKL